MPTLLRRDGIPLAAFVLLTLVMTNPLVLHLASAVEDKQDALLNTWIIAWVGHALIADPLNLFNTNIFYPFSNTLAYSETMLPQGLFALPINLAFHNTVLGYNLVLLGSFFLAAYGMYLFVFDLTRSRGAAAVAGAIFAFNPYNLGNLAQVQLLSFGWLPLAMMYLRRMAKTTNIDSQMRSTELKGASPLDRSGPFGPRPSLPPGPSALAPRSLGDLRPSLLAIRFSLLFALFFSLQVLSSFYFAFLAGLAVLFYVTWLIVLRCIAFHSNLRFLFSKVILPLTARLIFASVIIAVIVFPFLLPYLEAQRDQGFQRTIAESEPFSASLVMYSQVTPQNVIYGGLLAPHPPIMLGGYPLDNLFPGIVSVGLAIIALVAAKDRERWFYFLLLICAFILSLGPRFYLTPTDGTDITLPYRWLYDAIPLMKAFRAPVRFDALVMFALAVLAGFGIAALLRTQLANRLSNFEFRLSGLAVALIVLEYLALPAANTTPVPTGSAIPPYVHWLAQQPPGVVLELPMIWNDPSQPPDLTPQYLSTYHWQRTPDGYSGFNPWPRGGIAYEMESFAGERSISLLQALDVKYVIDHAGPVVGWDAQTPDVEPLIRFGADQVYQIKPRAQDPHALSVSLYLPEPAAPGRDYLAYVVVQNRADRSFAIKPTDMPRVEARWNDGNPQEVTAIMPLVTTRVSVVPVQVLAPSSAGDYHLDLRITGDAIGEWDLSGDVSVQNGEPTHQTVLPAQVSLTAPLNPSYAPGDAVEARLVWRPLNKIDAYYSASVRVVDSHGSKIAAVDRQPAGQTLLWSPGNAVADEFTLMLPRDLAPGAYSLQVLMYQADQHVDALLLDDQYVPQQAITLGTFTVR